MKKIISAQASVGVSRIPSWESRSVSHHWLEKLNVESEYSLVVQEDYTTYRKNAYCVKREDNQKGKKS